MEEKNKRKDKGKIKKKKSTTKEIKIVHLSDIHLGKKFMPKLAEKVIKKINDISPDIVIGTGDFTTDGRFDEFCDAKNFLGKIKCDKKIIVPGNHDARNRGDVCFEDIFGPRSSVHEYNVDEDKGITIVGIDSAQPDCNDGHIGRDKYEWIEKSLSTDNFKIVALHHHLLPIPKSGRDGNILTDASDVLGLLSKHKVDLALCGHRHVSWVWELNGMIVCNAGTACSNRTQYNIEQSFNLIKIRFGKKKKKIEVFRFPSDGKKETLMLKVLR